MSFYYDMDGQPISLQDFSRLLTDRHYKHVGLDEVGNARVSTVLLFIDHNWTGQGPPILFETMIFGGTFDGELTRYHTKDEALAGHVETVAALMADQAPAWTFTDGAHRP